MYKYIIDMVKGKCLWIIDNFSFDKCWYFFCLLDIWEVVCFIFFIIKYWNCLVLGIIIEVDMMCSIFFVWFFNFDYFFLI